MIKVGLLGLGKTGKIVAQSFLHDKRFDLVFAVKNNAVKTSEFHFVVEPKEMLPQLINRFKPQVIIDFTTPEATMKNIRCLKIGVNMEKEVQEFKVLDKILKDVIQNCGKPIGYFDQRNEQEEHVHNAIARGIAEIKERLLTDGEYVELLERYTKPRSFESFNELEKCAEQLAAEQLNRFKTQREKL